MDTQPRILHMDRLSNGVVIAFDDGKTALYSDDFLIASFPGTLDLTNLPNPDEEAG